MVLEQTDVEAPDPMSEYHLGASDLPRKVRSGSPRSYWTNKTWNLQIRLDVSDLADPDRVRKTNTLEARVPKHYYYT